MALRSARSLLAVAVAACGASGMFVVMTVAVEPVRPAVLLGVGCVVALAALVLVHGGGALAEMRSASRPALMLAAAGGAVALWAAPLLAQSQRASDTPSGADVLFLTTTVWALCSVAAAYAVRSERLRWTGLAAALAAAAATAGLLASWETPSSFSPFAKFPVREALMLAAAALFAAGALAIARAARSAGWRAVSLAATAGAAALGLLGALVALMAGGALDRAALVLGGYLGLSLAIFMLGWTQALAEAGVARTAAALFAVPIVVMATSFFESSLNVYGPSPVAWPTALAATAAMIAGIVVLWLAERPAAAPRALSTAPGRVAFWVAAAAAALAVGSLFTAALTATASGGTTAPFEATWTMVGAESASGWLVLAAAGLALAAVVSAGKGAGVRAWLPASVAALVCEIAAFMLRSTTLHTWNGWVPADVQQTYGTEYSRLVTTGLIEPVRLAAAALVLAALVAVALASRSRTNTNKTSEEDS